MGDILATMRLHGREEITVVVDKGMNAEENFAAIDAAAGVGFITTYSPYYEERFVHVDMEKFSPVDTVRNRELAGRGLEDDRLLAWRTTGEYWGATRSVIVTYNPVTAAKQRYAFDRKLATLGAWLMEVVGKVNSHARGWRDAQKVSKRIAAFCKERRLREELYDIRFEETPKGLQMLCCRNEYQIRRRLDWFGKNIIIASRAEWSTEEIVQASIDRYIVEEAFRKAKGGRLVSISPIRHWTDSKMRCHILSCIMAEVYLRLIELKLADAGCRHTADVVMRSMHEMHSSLCWVRGQKAPQRMIEEPDELQSSILAAFGYKVVEGKMLPLDACLPPKDAPPQKRGRPKGSKGKGQVKAEAPKLRGRPPKHLLGTAL
jgi:transposase